MSRRAPIVWEGYGHVIVEDNGAYNFEFDYEVGRGPYPLFAGKRVKVRLEEVVEEDT